MVKFYWEHAKKSTNSRQNSTKTKDLNDGQGDEETAKEWSEQWGNISSDSQAD
jgi:hypothetical protein